MIQTIYYIILIYFILGGIGFYAINRKKPPGEARDSYIKFITYFFIINILFFSITINSTIFRYVMMVIIGAGVFEFYKLFKESGFRRKGFFIQSLLLYLLLSVGLYHFSGLGKELILFSFLILSIFDSFSQITGQLWGKKKIMPSISPNKTLGGLVGGASVALGSALLLGRLFPGSRGEALLISAGIVVFAFVGDVAASWYKRIYNVKNYSNLIPGHGGFLDRFDSLIAGGAWVALSVNLINC